ncbi:hypothetical protein DFH29DRAFT_912718 [Suillus ampliporus]|nr:hypothetical protein DFH29DRAFT_912718 [Suillus ampliporus]
MTIHHILLYKFKPETTQEQEQFIKDSISALPSQIPAIQGLITGSTMPNAFMHGYDGGDLLQRPRLIICTGVRRQ